MSIITLNQLKNAATESKAYTDGVAGLAMAQTGANLLVDGGFEAADYWTANMTSGMSIVSDETHSGNYCLATTGDAGSLYLNHSYDGGCTNPIEIPVEANATYLLSGYYKTTEDAEFNSSNTKIRVGSTDGNNTLIANTGAASVSTNWTYISATWTNTAGYTSVYVTVVQSITAGTVYWDDVRFEKIPDTLGTSTIGGTSKGIYLNKGTPTALSDTIGSANYPVYMSNGAIANTGVNLAAINAVATTANTTAASAYTQANSAYTLANTANNAVANLSIGGTNLLPRTRMMETWGYSTCTVEMDEEGFGVITFPESDTLNWSKVIRSQKILYSRIADKEITISLWYRSDDADVFGSTTSTEHLQVELDLSEDDSLSTRTFYGTAVNIYSLSDEWQKCTVTMTPSESKFASSGTGEYSDVVYVQLRVYDYSTCSAQIKKIKLELGNVATDWSPAPENSEDHISYTANTAVGGTANPIYVTADGEATALSATVGGANFPVYLSSGTIVNTGWNVASVNAIAYAANSLATNAYAEANTASSTATSAYSQANSAYSKANSAYTLANTANTTAASANTLATTANTTAANAYAQANSAYTLANTANTTAASAYTKANSAYTLATTANTTATSASNLATSANTTATNAYTLANSVYSLANNANATAEAANNTATSAYTLANSVYSLANNANATAESAYTLANNANNTAASAYAAISNAVTHTANTAVGSSSKPVYVAANGAAVAITASAGNGVRLSYTSNGTVTNSTSTVGATNRPVYLASGVVTQAIANNRTAIGYSAVANANFASAYGNAATATSNYATAIGYDSNACGNYSVAIGSKTIAASNCVAVGNGASAPNYNCVAIGAQANADYLSDTAVGYSTYAPSDGSTAVGAYANAKGASATAIGLNTVANAIESTALGAGSNADANYATALGSTSTASANRALAVGYNAQATANNATAIGRGSACANVNGIQLGHSSGTSSLTCKVALTTTSDIRDKADVEEIGDGATEFLKSLKAIRFVFNQRESYIDEENLSDEDKEKLSKYGLCAYDTEAYEAGTKKGTRIRGGVSAQEVQSALSAVYGDSSYTDLVNDNLYDFDADEIPDDVESKLAVNYSGFIPYLIKAFQELELRMTSAENAIGELLE